ncbi:DUF4412 domain-containing protein [Aquimarina pacifica]|uniref:DUF4412 domain-containing protein n=1 Tax=Aquimarina pacifica TaxID=1296415 RepID=UPI0004710FD2|nr:DUF4412 domain-containing protein [Aquimarina pacifica]
MISESKNLSLLFVILSIIFWSPDANAQFFKKLKEKAEKAAERAIEKKVEQKTEKETEKAFDSTFNRGSASKKNKNVLGVSKVQPASSYLFTHKYVMNLEIDKNTTTFDYYLIEDKEYMGFKVPGQEASGMFGVIDMSRSAMFSFMNNGGQQIYIATNMNPDEIANENLNRSKPKVTKTGKTKNILGYSSYEYLIKSDEFDGIAWITEDAEVEFSNYYSAKNRKSKASDINDLWKDLPEGLVMEMDITDISQKKPTTIKMKCLALEKEALTIDTSSYKSMY